MNFLYLLCMTQNLEYMYNIYNVYIYIEYLYIVNPFYSIYSTPFAVYWMDM